MNDYEQYQHALADEEAAAMEQSQGDAAAAEADAEVDEYE